MKQPCLFLLIASSLLFTRPAFGQGEIVAGYGLFSSPEVKSISSLTLNSDLISIGGNLDNYVEGRGPWTVGFRYSFENKISVGVFCALSSTRVRYFIRDTDGFSTTNRQVVLTDRYAGLVSLRYTWLHFRGMSLYSGISGGAGYAQARNQDVELSKNEITPAYQLNAIGMRAGGRFGAYLELGYGYAGVANVGLSLIF